MRTLLLLLVLLDTSPRRGSYDPRRFKLIRSTPLTAGRANILSPNGRTLATYAGNNVILTDTLTGKELFTMAGHTQNIHDGGWSRDGRILATSGYDGVVKLWDAGAGKEVRSINAHAGYA